MFVKLILIYLIIINLITFILFGLDKFKARKNSWRISENKLLFFTLLGGILGGLLGMVVYRHKTIKASFQIKFYLIVIIWILFILYILGK